MAQPVDPKAYYGYLFHDDKKPTKVLDALLRGIANYISASLGDKEDKALTPAKLATFYKAVGGNYDTLFVDVPHPSISWIYASIGCQHTLQPTTNDFEPPSVPALTTRGFVRWQAIEILLGPEEHVPFIQNAIRDFGIKNPDTGEAFPLELPTEAFPIKADPAIEKWHSECATKLRERATPESESVPSRSDLPPRPKVQTGYAHVRPHRPTRVEPEYFEPRSRVSTRPLSYQHIPSAGARPVRPQISRSPSHRARQFLAPEEPASPRIPRTRRRSFPENLNGSSPSPPTVLPDPVPVSRPPPHPRHERAHSHPRHPRRGSASSDASSEDEEPPSPTTPIPEAPRRRAHSHAHAARVEVEVEPESRFNPSVPTPPDPRRRIPREQLQDREEDLRRRSHPTPIDNSGKLSAPFMAEKRNSVRDRDRDRTRDSRERDSRRNSREREREPRSKSRGEHKVSWKDLSNLSTVTDLWRKGTSKDGSQDESRPRTSAREDREYKRREKEREREREFRDSDRDHERESGRPRVQPRRSSHEDVPRRDRDRERDRDDFGRGQDIGRGSDRRSFRDRDRDRRAASPIRGVDGRRYPSHA